MYSLYWLEHFAHFVVEPVLDRQFVRDDVRDQLRDRLRIGGFDNLRRQLFDELAGQIRDEFPGKQHLPPCAPAACTLFLM